MSRSWFHWVALLAASALLAAPLCAAAEPLAHDGAAGGPRATKPVVPVRPVRAAQKAPRKKPKGAPRSAGRGGTAAASPSPAPAPTASSTGAHASAAVAPPGPTQSLERFTLDNGLRVVLAPDRASPEVVVAMTYDAGSRNEERGSAGVARLVERLMTQGSANVPRGDHERLIGMRGGKTRSFVTEDATTFVDLAPSSELPLLLWLEADRSKSLVITPEAVASQRDALVAERRLAGETSLVGEGRARLRELVFQGQWAHEHDPRGVLADIAQLKPEAARSFFETFYVSSNVVLTVVGDFEVEHATMLVHRFFETARKQERPGGPAWAPGGEQTSQRIARVEGPGAQGAATLIGWLGPAGRTDESTATVAALTLLADGPGSRLWARLVAEQGVATSVRARLEQQHGQGLVGVEIDLVDERHRDEALRAVDRELEGLVRSGPSEAELARLRLATHARAWRTHLDPVQRAIALGEAERLHGDAHLAYEALSRVFALHAEQVRAAAARYLSAPRRSLVDVASARGDEPGQAPMAAPHGAPRQAEPAPQGRPPQGRPSQGRPPQGKPHGRPHPGKPHHGAPRKPPGPPHQPPPKR